jgi:malate dehydrogenase
MKITVIGASGYVGSNVAFILAIQGLADELVLIAPNRTNIVEHLAMDIATAVTDKKVIVRPGGYDDMKDSNIVIMCGGAPQGLIKSRMEMLDKNLPIIRDVGEKARELCPSAVVVTATNPVDPMNYAMYLATGFDRHRLVGYSMNDTLRFRALVAQTLGQVTRDVEGFAIGEHGESQVLLFSSVRVKGKPVKFDDATKIKILAHIPEILRSFEELRTGRTSGITSAVGMREIVDAIVNNTHAVVPSSVVLDGEYGQHGMSMGVPVQLGTGGVYKVIEPELAPDEQAQLDNTLTILKPAMARVDSFFGVKV